MSLQAAHFLPTVAAWLQRNPAVKSAVLFGSNANRIAESAPTDEWSDLDLHLIATDPVRLERADWSAEIAGFGFCMQVIRPATGGVKKISVLFQAGQIDLVVVPLRLARIARGIVLLRLHHRMARNALNEMATCLRTGYRFLKGDDGWKNFYHRIASEMPGVRMDDALITQHADAFLFDLLWVFQKIERGELIAAQHMLHRGLVETNLRLLRELRLRRDLSVPSFGLGRRVEMLCSTVEQRWVEVSALREATTLRAAAWSAFDGLQKLMQELAPSWSVPHSAGAVLSQYRGS